MKEYKILADSVTGFRNKHLTHGKAYKAHDFIQKDIPHLLEIKAIEEVSEELPEKPLEETRVNEEED